MKLLTTFICLLMTINIVNATNYYTYNSKGQKTAYIKQSGNVSKVYDTKGHLQSKYVQKNNKITQYAPNGKKLNTIVQK